MFSFNVETAEIFIYDDIGPEWMGLASADSVIAALAKMAGKHVKVRLNTPGGSVDEGVAIYNAIQRHEGGTTVIVDSLAASMGSYLLQASERRIVASNAMVMIHNPWTFAVGNATDLRKAADVLDLYLSRMTPDYASRSGKTIEEMQTIMSEETWYVGQAIVDAGFADEVGAESNVEPMTKNLAKFCAKAPPELFERREKSREQLLQFPRRAAAAVASAKMSEAKSLG